MTAAWIVNALVVSGFVVAGAALLEWTLRERLSSRTRWLWLAAMVASVSLPFLGPWLSATLAPLRLPSDLSVSHWMPAVDFGAGTGAVTESRSGFGWIGPLWMALSLGLGLIFGATVLALRRQVQGWRRGSVAGVPVRYTEDFGPAVVGFRPARIILPTWALKMDTRRRRLLLLHEGEHARAGDVALLHAGFLLLAIMPWNPLLWWSFRRLRLSLELDCDRRVLHAGAPLRHYAEMLLDLPRPHATRPVLAAVAFAPIRSHLGRRIDMITRSRSSLRGPMRPALAGSLAALLFVLACDAAVTTDPPSPANQGALDARARQERVTVQKAAKGFLARLDKPAGEGPLVVVDGNAWPAESLNVLAPEQIASVEVVKGPSAVARFGAAAANGAVLITRLEASRKP